MNPRRKKRLSIALVIVIGLGSMTGLVLYALKQNIDLFYTPTQLVEGLGEDKVKPEIKVSFILSDDRGGLVTLEYEGILPDLFREGQGIVAQGVLKSANVIAASEVLAKHDEEYMPPEVAEAIKGIKHMKPEYGNETK
ncbi:cytochrome c maturation protein CcmE [Moritella viscosa]